MERLNPNEIIMNFIDKMDYLNNEHVLGCFLW